MEQQNIFRQNSILPLEDLLASSDKKSQRSTVKHGSEFPRTSFDEPRKFSTRDVKEPVMPPSLKEELKAEAETQPIAKSSHKRPVVWGLLGFTFGVIFWHFVGFWGFVEDAVLKGPTRGQYTNSIIGNEDLNTKGSITYSTVKTRQLVDQSHHACVSLVMDRFTKETYSQPCQQGKAYYQGQQVLKTAARSDLW